MDARRTHGQQYRRDARLFPSRWTAADFRSSIDEVVQRSGNLIVGFVAVPQMLAGPRTPRLLSMTV
ncbi:hypothetical protein [Rhodococcus sp. (in: high G+C Gram-positive bacteria)]|uniref:hypothetical protein n=1 Tax=Rhodococcus sp. TaxID=1831 RepID=UPI00257B50DF|nr:hypothetical protein [Rhodococcus sp. (in: high G+C Gram-positive bacteria)]MBQ9055518.1 hypothetical protein [Rhodococcus sp. (in: high G+C Gram-positive bacteria)]